MRISNSFWIGVFGVIISLGLSGGWAYFCWSFYEKTLFRMITAYSATSIIGTTLGLFLGMEFFSRSSSGHMPSWGSGVPILTLVGLVAGVLITPMLAQIRWVYVVLQAVVVFFILLPFISMFFPGDSALR